MRKGITYVREKTAFYRGFILLYTFVFLLSACRMSRGTENPPAEISKKNTELPSKNIEPFVVVTDQPSDGRTVVVEEVTGKGPGWLVVYTQKNGKPDSVIGYASVRDGVNKNVVVRIDPELATGVMYAVLHSDAGQIGTFEYPGPDSPEEVAGKTVSESFKLRIEAAVINTPRVQESEQSEGLADTGEPLSQSNSASLDMATGTPGKAVEHRQSEHVVGTPEPDRVPALKVADQEIKDGMVEVQEVTSNGPGWLVIYSAQDGQPVEVIGYTAVQDGENRSIKVQVDASKVTPELYALLHTDAGKIGTFEYPGPDMPVLSDVRVVLDQFNVNSVGTESATPSPEPNPDVHTIRVIASDQPIRGGTVKIAEVVSDGPGWLGIHMITPDGKIGSAIGSALLHDGLNKDVIVPIDESRATRSMNAMLHFDKGKAGVWEFPGPDAPVMINNEMVMMYFNVTRGLVGQEVKINVADAETPYLTDGQGLSLYVSLSDKQDRSLCDAECHKTWLPLLATGQVVAGKGVDLNRLGVILLTKEDKQVTYNGLPLYYYAGDSLPGDSNGQGMDGRWFLSVP